MFLKSWRLRRKVAWWLFLQGVLRGNQGFLPYFFLSHLVAIEYSFGFHSFVFNSCHQNHNLIPMSFAVFAYLAFFISSHILFLYLSPHVYVPHCSKDTWLNGSNSWMSLENVLNNNNKKKRLFGREVILQRRRAQGNESHHAYFL